MNYYIQKNMEIQKIFQDFAAPDDIFPYSIDEGFLDLTSSINYFIPDQTLDRRTKLDLLAARIQQAIWKKTGIFRFCAFQCNQCVSGVNRTNKGITVYEHRC